MKLAWILFAAGFSFLAQPPALAQQPGFDFRSLDKLGANASGRTSINLEGDALKAAAGLFGDALRNLTGVYVHSYEFAQKGQYNPQDIEPVRAYLRTLNWTKIVDSKEGDETSEIYIKPLQNGKIGGLAVVDIEPTEVTVVFISGEVSLGDLNKLNNLGIPDIRLGGGKPESPKKD